MIHYAEAVAEILELLPKEGFLFKYLASVQCKDRATEFKHRCRGLGIEGLTLHSFRYAWAERARKVGMLLQLCELRTSVANDPVLPVNVFGAKASDIALRTAQMPKELVKEFSLNVLFSVDDLLIFFKFDGSLLRVLNFGPGLTVEKWAKEPLHIQGEIMQTPEIVVR